MPPPYPRPPVPPLPARSVATGAAVAAAAWGVMFAGDRRRFWTRAAVAGATVGGFALAARPEGLRRVLAADRPARDVAVGAASGLALYGAFWAGEQVLVVLAPALAEEVGDLYAVRGAVPHGWIPAVLAVAATGEELFFRGFLQDGAGLPVALAVYGGVHLWERKVILPVAAVVGGVWWGGLLRRTGSLVAPLTSHLLWALLIIWLRPARPTDAARRLSRRLGALGLPQWGRPPRR